MRLILNVLAVLLILAGGVWFLQGINLLPGSFMTGQVQWAVYGVIAILAGIGLLVLANRHRGTPPGNRDRYLIRITRHSQKSQWLSRPVY